MITCAYYRSNLDRTLWAIRASNGRIIDAIGPLPDSDMLSVPMERRSAIKMDVTGWDIGAFRCVSPVYKVVKRTDIATGLPRRKPDVKLIETANGFSCRLNHV
jgi:hypothetical protein